MPDMVASESAAFGPRLLDSGHTLFRFWAPGVDSVGLCVNDDAPVAMQMRGDGWYEAEADCGAGARYQFKLPSGDVVPDPASRLQDGDANDASIVVDPAAFAWRETAWKGRPWHETVIYELHLGAMGGFSGVTADLPRLANLGVTAVELMPIADFMGGRNWGYDGVLPYAPDTSYGTPDELRTLIDTAHGLGLMVFLDVVYNHFGPDGNYLSSYAPQFFRSDRKTPWGDAIDFERPQVHRFFIDNAIYWLVDYRFDGLRFDAVHAIEDDAFLLSLAEEVRAAMPPGRHVHLCLENENNDAALLNEVATPSRFNAQWADDMHHCLHVLLTGESEAYYEAFSQEPARLLARCLAEGFAFQGEAAGGKDSRGTPSAHLPPTAFIMCLQNHDQIGNRAFGDRLSSQAHPDALKVATALLLLSPQIPLMFMGQEWASKAPFPYFAGFEGELGEAVKAGRRKEFETFAAFSDEATRETIPDPIAIETFHSAVVDATEQALDEHADWFSFHRMLLQLRAREIMPRIPGTGSISAGPLGKTGVVARWKLGDGTQLMILANLGADSVPCGELGVAMPQDWILFQQGHFDAAVLGGHSIMVLLEAAA